MKLEGLKEVRFLKGLTQEELAERAGVSRYTVIDLEAGRHEARPGTARKLAEALDTDIAALVGRPSSDE
jgi:transcriptional regulator with XRE-family HTH domain